MSRPAHMSITIQSSTVVTETIKAPSNDPPPYQEAASGSSSDIQDPPPTETITEFSRTTSIFAPPPSYDSVPKPLSATLFYWGFLCPPLWILGYYKLFAPTPCVGAEKLIEDQHPNSVGVSLEDFTISSDHWRDQEVMWAKRCGVALLSTLAIVAVGIVTLVSVIYNL